MNGFNRMLFLGAGVSNAFGVDYEWDEPQLVIDTMNPLAIQDELEYLKLHGSIDWWIRNKDNRIVMRESNYSLMGEIYSKRSMIYPAYDKRISKEPSASLYSYFLRLLQIHDVYVVVGYSFRDQSINDAFEEALRRERARMGYSKPSS